MTKAIFIAILCIGIAVSQSNAQDSPKLKTFKDSVSYGIGVSIGKNIKKQEIDVDPSIIAAAMRDVIGDKKTVLSDDDIQKVMGTLQAEVGKKMQEKASAASSENKKKGTAFLAANKKKEGVIVTPSGLQYKVIKSGTGKQQPVDTSTVKTHYKGTLIDGKEFDSSYKRGEPAEFPVKGVIKGWTEALKLMHEGDKWELYIPSDLAYGDQAMGADIPPGSTLIFEIELISIVK